MTMLGLLSLPYCYAAADGAQVLRLSERLTNDATKRLQETAQFVWQVLQPHSFESDGPGWSSVRQVRLVHALVRHHAAKHPHWNHAWGLPVNQEDQAGTNLAFSLVVLRGLRRMHLLISPEEAEAFLHRWRVIGFLLGIDPLVLPATLQEAYYLDRAIVRRHFRESDAGKALTKALLHSLHEQAPAFRLAPYYMRFLLGDDVADLLELPRDATQQFLLEPLRVANAFRSATGSAFGQPPLPVQFKNYFAFPIPTWPVAS
ncbi:hypothetical protein SAMN05421823_1084 [Catalinimonas alkaloidigena]|uniref:ER-bound oxygenase mpaB/mpaB'/Rubber oxygenase catalytic domain-containing protein n=2 Tax=Catalinimonas alkaloidigena TaxID=1075417 RepID=A0A1G9MJI3_9BACT|nr:hypothetical protein SAMN05421823_1084 [Catalinimonas alkaloidigena]